MTLEVRPRFAKRSGSEVDISEWSSVIYFSCLTTLTKYDISGGVFFYLPPSIYPSSRLSGELRVPGQRGATHTRPACTGYKWYNTTRNPRTAKILLLLSLSLSSPLLSSPLLSSPLLIFLFSLSPATRGLFFATSENVYICLLRQLTLHRTLRTKSVL